MNKFKHFLANLRLILAFHYNGLTGKRKGVLIYVGLHRSTEFSTIFSKFKKAYGIEANPELAEFSKNKFKWFGKSVEIINAAATTFDGEIELNISNRDGGASSLGSFSPEWKNSEIQMTKKITVPAINLPHFLQSRGITMIDEYISDIQGMDYTVLETLKDLINQKKIQYITCETTKDGKKNIYHDLPSNEFHQFQNLLSKNYKVVGKGWGIVNDGQINEVPEDWWEFDCRWKLK
jgi:FkbM family methyltransferase